MAPSRNWRAVVSELFNDAEFDAPATPREIERTERELNVGLPQQLRSLYLETNGVHAHYGSALIWNVEDLVVRNREFRGNADFAGLYMPFDALLFFGEHGNGDQAAYRILRGSIPDASVFKWNHEDDSRLWFARDLRDYFHRCALGDE